MIHRVALLAASLRGPRPRRRPRPRRASRRRRRRRAGRRRRAVAAATDARAAAAVQVDTVYLTPQVDARGGHRDRDRQVEPRSGDDEHEHEGGGRLMTEPRSVRDDPRAAPPRDPSRPLPRVPPGRRPRRRAAPRPRPEPARRRPDPGPLRMLVAFAGIASASALTTAMLPSVAPSAAPASLDAGATAGQSRRPAPSVRHVNRYVTLKPGQTAPPQPTVSSGRTPTPRVSQGRHPDPPVGQAVTTRPSPAARRRRQRPMMGGRVSVHLRDESDRRRPPGDAAERVLDRIAAWAGRLTRFDAGLRARAPQRRRRGAVPVGPTLTAVLDWAREPRADDRRPRGRRDARRAPGGRGGRRRRPAAAAARRWSLPRLPRGAVVEREPGVRFDLDGVAKGWLADRALAIAPGRSALVDGDGDVAARVAPGRRVARRHRRPAVRRTRLLAVIRLAAADGRGASGSRRPAPASTAGTRAAGDRPPPHRPRDLAAGRDGRRPGHGARGHRARGRGVRQGRRHRRHRPRLRAARPPGRPRGAPAHHARRDPRHAGDAAMAGMTFRGLDSRTSLARWGLAAVAIGIVAGATVPGGARGLAAAWTATGRACPGCSSGCSRSSPTSR